MKKIFLSFLATGLLVFGFGAVLHGDVDESDYPDLLNPIEHNQ